MHAGGGSTDLPKLSQQRWAGPWKRASPPALPPRSSAHRPLHPGPGGDLPLAGQWQPGTKQNPFRDVASSSPFCKAIFYTARAGSMPLRRCCFSGISSERRPLPRRRFIALNRSGRLFRFLRRFRAVQAEPGFSGRLSGPVGKRRPRVSLHGRLPDWSRDPYPLLMGNFFAAGGCESHGGVQRGRVPLRRGRERDRYYVSEAEDADYQLRVIAQAGDGVCGNRVKKQVKSVFTARRCNRRRGRRRVPRGKTCVLRKNPGIRQRQAATLPYE